MKTTKFTLKEAFNIQAKDLMMWDSILNDKTSILLWKEALRRNIGVTDPYDVFRGSDISYFIENLVIKNRS
jgi:hypothetical protein